MTKLHIISLTPQHPFKRLEVVRNPAVTLSYLYSSESLFGLPFAWIIMLIRVATYLGGKYAPKLIFFNEKKNPTYTIIWPYTSIWHTRLCK